MLKMFHSIGVKFEYKEKRTMDCMKFVNRTHQHLKKRSEFPSGKIANTKTII